MKTYPAHAIPVDVYCEGRKVLDAQHICVQVSLDMELWINDELQTKLLEQGVTYHSLTDYDVQLAEVRVCPICFMSPVCIAGCRCALSVAVQY